MAPDAPTTPQLLSPKAATSAPSWSRQRLAQTERPNEGARPTTRRQPLTGSAGSSESQEDGAGASSAKFPACSVHRN